MDIKPTFVELLVKKGCTAEVYVNGIPLPRISSPEQPFIARPGYPFLVNGKNILELLVEPGPTPSLARAGKVPQKPTEATARARVTQYPEGAFVGSDDAEVFASVNWLYAPKPDQPGPEFYPVSVRREFNFVHDFGPWVWQRVDGPIDLKRDADELNALVVRLHRAFNAGDPAPILDLMGPYVADVVKTAPGIERGDYLEELASDIRGNARREDFVRPLELKDIDYRLVANGAMVELVYRDWTPVLNTLPQEDGEIFPLPVFVGRLDGKLQILR
jgi:hypothetical protein